MNKALIALALFLASTSFCLSQKRIAVIGSSTAAGSGASRQDSAWVNLAKKYYEDLGKIDTIYNLAVPASLSSNGLPGSTDLIHNITAALGKIPAPDVIIISYPTNDIAGGVPMSDYLSNLRTMYGLIIAAGKIGYVATTQPRNDFTSDIVNKQLNLIKGRDSIIAQYPLFSLNFFDPLVDPNTANVAALNPIYDEGSHIHPNDAGHQLLFQVVKNNLLFQTGPLALSLDVFDAHLQNGNVAIKWTTFKEDGTASFEIQRSSEGTIFNTLHTEQGKPNAGSGAYSWTDIHPLPGNNFYRLKIVEAEGPRYSPILKVINVSEKEGGLISRIITLDADHLQIEVNNLQNVPVGVSIFNEKGALVRKLPSQTNPGSSKIPVSISGLAPGIYFLNVTAGAKGHETRSFRKL